jgi:hypothetical protein
LQSKSRLLSKVGENFSTINGIRGLVGNAGPLGAVATTDDSLDYAMIKFDQPRLSYREIGNSSS